MSTKTQMKSVLITVTDDLNKAIIAVNKSAHKLSADIQIVLASSVYFAMKDGNIEPLNASILAVGRGVRKQAMADWSMKFAPVLANTGKDAKEKPFIFSREKFERLAGHKANMSAEAATTYAETAYGTLWTELKEPPLIPETFNLGQKLAQLVKQAEGYQGNGKTNVVGADLLPMVKRLAGQFAPSVKEAETEAQPS